jgi:hypothetical protein
MNKCLIIALVLLLAQFFCACGDGFEDYSTNPDDRLAFSTDTVAFDTIISTIVTPYQYFKVYNRHSKALLISSVSLEKGAGSPFRINVDGQAGSVFQNLEIRANDSIYVLVDAKPAENHVDEPQSLNEAVVFVTNGVRQDVQIAATAQDATLWRGVVLDSDTVLGGPKPFVIYDSLIVREGVTVEIREGARFYMHGNAEMVVQGTLKMKGLRENPILIRGDRFDYFVNIPYDRVPGQWGGIRFTASSYDNEWEHVRIRNGKFGLRFDPSDTLRLKMRMKNVVLTNFKGLLLSAVNCRIEAENCEFSNAKDALLNLAGGVYDFTHCTIANYYPSHAEAGWGNSNNETIRLMGSFWNETAGETEYFPLLRAGFYNSVIWGNSRIGSGIAFDSDERAVVRFLFQNCLIPNAEATNDEPENPEARVVRCLINKDPLFRLVDGEKFQYDFRLDSLSPVRNLADLVIAQRVPVDLEGNERLGDEGADLGAYEFVGKGEP